MDFDLGETRRALQERTREFARRRLGADLVARDRRGAEDADDWLPDWRACAEFGLLGCLTPPEFGGQGHDVLTAVAMLEALGEGCPDNGLALAIGGQLWAVIEPILAFGTQEQQARWLPGLADGSLVGAHGMTEAASGSDAFALATRARRTEGGYFLDGEKIYVGLAPACDLALVFASTDPPAGAWGLSAFLVEAGDESFERGPIQPKMGLRTTPMGTLRLRGCFVPEDRRLGDEGDGSAIFQHSMEWERSFIFAGHVGAMARQLAVCTAFARDRRVFGRTIDGHQSVSNRLADMALRLETSRLLLYKAAWLKSRGDPCAEAAALAKLHISEAFAASSLDAIRIHGGRGYIEEAGIERDLRDAVGGLIYSGTSDIQRRIIAASLPERD
jgi:alkylation response protein AidB-like acyl-CoA dehydrogenase